MSVSPANPTEPMTHEEIRALTEASERGAAAQERVAQAISAQSSTLKAIEDKLGSGLKAEILLGVKELVKVEHDAWDVRVKDIEEKCANAEVSLRYVKWCAAAVAPVCGFAWIVVRVAEMLIKKGP
jgi:CHASE3 domain sensor protein